MGKQLEKLDIKAINFKFSTLFPEPTFHKKHCQIVHCLKEFVENNL